MADPISLPRLAIALAPVLGLLIWLVYDGHSVRTSVQGLARMLIQLSLVGYILVFLFKSDQAWVSLATLSVMMLAASAIAIRTSNKRPLRRYAQVLTSVALGGGISLATVIFGVLNVDPWYSPQILIPLAGMTFSNCMNALSLAIERLDGDTDSDPDHAVRVALIPITNSLYAVGVVSIPGMMTGQVLAGVSPLIAARYQIMIMCLIFSSAGLSLLIFMRLQRIERRAKLLASEPTKN
ncbi:ABC transporter permease [Aporhodopirellula aestuarii]|uniref:ABC transporter permease n=1 Tax=Aporhodopirellula aestuarii TaxID=2950107 RepID=A0ABT0UBF6_9BACT|nr:ABC transporter permease [Aporhodopirellula aestuarii]MCM2374323.1 ABC transporter permease [Aporhodopirellula aestuarii]